MLYSFLANELPLYLLRERKKPFKETRESMPKSLWRSWKLWIIVLLFVAATILLILSSQSIIAAAWGTILSIILSALGVLFTCLSFLLSFFSNPGTSTPPPPPPQLKDVTFLPCMPLEDPSEFFGRTQERMTLFNRIRRGGSTSIVGERRIGKTWLMRYIQLAGPAADSRYRVGYIDAQSANCETIDEFTTIALAELGVLQPSSNGLPLDLAALNRAIGSLRANKLVPVLCIDEFEHLFSNPSAFPLSFFEGLRSMTQSSNGLILITASRKPLNEKVGSSGLTSPLFNVLEVLELKSFTPEEAETFVRKKGAQARLTARERAHLERYGRNEPLRLQLAGEMLEADKRVTDRTAQNYYRQNDPYYWRHFEERLETRYKQMTG
jgi:hypothetical protein